MKCRIREHNLSLGSGRELGRLTSAGSVVDLDPVPLISEPLVEGLSFPKQEKISASLPKKKEKISGR